MFNKYTEKGDSIQNEGHAVVLAKLFSELVSIQEGKTSLLATTAQGVIKSVEENIAYLLEHLQGHSIMNGRTTLTLKVEKSD